MRTSCAILFLAACACFSHTRAQRSPQQRHAPPTHARISNCQDCVAAGWGWCPIRRKCGGFANRECIGDADERDYMEPRVETVTDAELDFSTLSKAAKHRVVLVYDSSRTETEVLSEYEWAAVDAEHGTGSSSVAFLSADVKVNRVVKDLLVGGDDLPQALVFRKGSKGVRASADAEYAGPWTAESVLEFVESATTIRIPALDLKVKAFTEALLEAMQAQGDAATTHYEDMKLIAEDVAAAASEPDARPGAAVYAKVMDTMVNMEGSATVAMMWLASRVNQMAGDSVFSDELDIMQVFTSNLLG